MAKLKAFDPSAYLTNDEVVAEYLTAALEDPNPDVFLAAVGNVAKARGMSSIAEESGLGRESLYKALTPGAKPRYDTVLKVLQSLGVKLTVSAAQLCVGAVRERLMRARRRRADLLSRPRRALRPRLASLSDADVRFLSMKTFLQLCWYSDGVFPTCFAHRNLAIPLPTHREIRAKIVPMT